MLRMLTWWDRPMGKRVLLEVKSFSILITGLSVFKAMTDCSSEICTNKYLGLLTKNTGRESGCWGRSGPLAPSWSASGFSHSRLRDSAATFPACLPPPAWSTWSRCTFSSGVTWPSMLEQTETGQQCETFFFLVIPLSKRGNPRVL